MKTEIDQIKEILRSYKYPKNEKEFNSAQTRLLKLHNKYGTIDINIIKELIK